MSGETEIQFPIVVVGAGATGLCAALAARDAGVDVLVLERDPTPLGSTAMSTGLIPAAGTPEQAEQGVDDSPTRFAKDIMRKTKGRADAALVMELAQQSAETVSWLRDRHGVPLSLLDGFIYPGHTARRMYGTPNRAGSELMAALESAAQDAGAILLTEALVVDVLHDGTMVTGVIVRRPDGQEDRVACRALVIASSGFAGNDEMVREWIPEMANAVFHGHPGNKGDAIRWGRELGAAVADMQAYQGHGGLAAGHAVPILWPLIMEGGIQVNLDGERFSDESAGYSEQAAKVNAQPGHVAWSIFDERRHNLMLQFEDYQHALQAGAVIVAGTVAELAQKTNLPEAALANTLAEVATSAERGQSDRFGRDFAGKAPLTPPYRAAKVTGALFHTQGGLVVDGDARVLDELGWPLPNVFAGGGAARGVSGPGADGYMAGNGLLTATTLGKLAGRSAARLVCELPPACSR